MNRNALALSARCARLGYANGHLREQRCDWVAICPRRAALATHEVPQSAHVGYGRRAAVSEARLPVRVTFYEARTMTWQGEADSFTHCNSTWVVANVSDGSCKRTRVSSTSKRQQTVLFVKGRNRDGLDKFHIGVHACIRFASARDNSLAALCSHPSCLVSPLDRLAPACTPDDH